MTIPQQGIDRVHVHGVRDHRRRERIRREFLSTAPPNMFDNARELIKISFETDLYYETCAAYWRFFDEFDLPRRWLPPLLRIHVLSPTEYRRFVDPESGGKEMNTHTYIMRECGVRRRIRSAHVLSHEFAHAVSYYAIRVRVRGRVRNIRGAHSGVKLISDSQSRDRFEGLNEGTTEWMARFVRQRITRHSSIFTRVEKGLLHRLLAYPIHLRLVEELCMLLVRRKVTNKPFHLLFRDYLLGTAYFLDAIEDVHEGAINILASTDARSSSALDALRALRFYKAAKIMERFVDDTSKMF